MRRAALLLSLALALAWTWPAAAQSGVMQRLQYGVVVDAQPATVVKQGPRQGARVGSTVGAVAGYALADRGDRWLGALLGGVVGGAVGNGVEKKSRKKKGWSLIIRLDNGSEIGIDVPGKHQKFRPGDKVRLSTAGGQTRVTRV